MFATMAVRINIAGENEGGDLTLLNVANALDAEALERVGENDRYDVFENLYGNYQTSPEHPGTNELSIAVFYQDTPHMVEEVITGYRISFIFDIVRASEYIPMSVVSSPSLQND